MIEKKCDHFEHRSTKTNSGPYSKQTHNLTEEIISCWIIYPTIFFVLLFLYFSFAASSAFKQELKRHDASMRLKT
jgi:hypothetical protein